MSIFNQFKKREEFDWANLGNIKENRENLGEDMPVLVYRLMQLTLLDVLTKAHGIEQANEYFRQAGYLAGLEFAKNTLDITANSNAYIAQLKDALETLKIGIFNVEEFDAQSGKIVVTVGEDLECSGIPITNQVVCAYDEGFLSGVLEAHSGKKYEVREVDCWANGSRTCRFNGTVCG